MDYVIVENQSIVHLGPISWKPRMIQSDLDDLADLENFTLTYIVPQTEPGSYVLVNSVPLIEIYPISNYTTPESYNPQYEQLVGPNWTYSNNTAVAMFTTTPLDINIIKSNLKGVAADERFRRESLGTTANVTSNLVMVSLTTDRVNRNQYVTLLNSMGSNTINYKTGSGFITLTSADVQTMVTTVNSYVQAQFDWEKVMGNTIDAAVDIPSLQNIVIVAPVVNNLN